jgi:predicted metal-dependent hydrolase
MLQVDDQAAGPHDASLDHERIVLQARDVEFDWANLPVHYVPGEPFAAHFANVLHLLLPAGEEFFVELFKQALPLIADDQLRLDVQGFIGQEATHAQAHAGVVDYFAAKGMDMSPFTDQVRWLFEKLLGDRPKWSKRRQQGWLLDGV